MDSILRLLLRFLLVPLGYLAAVAAGALVILFGSWKLGELGPLADPDAQALANFSLIVAGPILFIILASTMWLPSAVGIVISEAFALRSWIYHALNGAVSAWLGWNLFGTVTDSGIPLNDPLPVIAAGIAGGFAYWAVAGWSAGFWKPVFRHREARAIATAR
jgi:hypothetical protein